MAGGVASTTSTGGGVTQDMLQQMLSQIVPPTTQSTTQSQPNTGIYISTVIIPWTRLASNLSRRTGCGSSAQWRAACCSADSAAAGGGALPVPARATGQHGLPRQTEEHPRLVERDVFVFSHCGPPSRSSDRDRRRPECCSQQAHTVARQPISHTD